ncbi:ATP-binding cassette domain-containing protein, partial [Bacillus mycoides]|uniref:ATP-binding cassette domain-containing protein n=1 Tax=Bacillus mycoides TaxID=1405 RepID=UPI002111ED60
FKTYVEFLETEPVFVDSKQAIDVKLVHGDIQYNIITFGYENKEPILNDISLIIHAGETVAFVGKSGAGKTTLCSLLPC